MEFFMKYSDGKDYKAIAICTAKFDDMEGIDFIKSFRKICLANNYRMFVFSSMVDFYTSSENDKGEEEIYSLMEPDHFDAVIIDSVAFKGPGFAERIAKRVLDAGVPCISLVRPLEGCINIRYRFSDGFEEVVRHMIEHHKPKHVNFIAGMKNNIFSDERLAIFRKVMAENGLEVEEDRIDYGGFWEGPTTAVMDRFLSSGKPIDCIICANDLMAMEACRKLRLADIRVPEDVIVSGFDGHELERYHYPRLCTSKTDIAEISAKAGELLERIFKGESVGNNHMINTTFREGQSCGCKEFVDSAEEMIKMGNKLYDSHKHERELISKMESLFSKVPRIGNSTALNLIWGELIYFVRDFFGGDFALALNTDFMGDNMEIWPNIRPVTMTEEHHYYTDELQIPMCYVNGEHTAGFQISRETLIPEFDKFTDNREVVLFLPVIVQNSTIGYTVSGFIPDGFEYFMLNAFLMNLRHILEMHKYRIDLQNLYSTDQLTKLLNRKGFYRHMESVNENAIRNSEDIGLISIDMNWLKQINDTYGHKEGDFALAKIGEVMNVAIGDDGVCTRFGGDEFAIAFASKNGAERAEKIMESINSQIEKFNAGRTKPYPLSVSMGFVVGKPRKDGNIEPFIVDADRKMYANKTKFKEHNSWEDRKVQ